MIQTISILGGRSREGRPEPVQRVDLQMGQVVSVVDPAIAGATRGLADRVSAHRVLADFVLNLPPARPSRQAEICRTQGKEEK